MALVRMPPYVAVSWIARMLVGDMECEYSAWCQAHHMYDKLRMRLLCSSATCWLASRPEMRSNGDGGGTRASGG